MARQPGSRGARFLPCFTFVLGVFIPIVYFQLRSDACIFQSIGISNSIVRVSPDEQRLGRYAGSGKKSDQFTSQVNHARKTRKILIDCGANTASTVQLFRETYPGGHDFVIHSFEIDSRLIPYFAPYTNHVLHCPLGVAGINGSMMAYTESVWSPDKGINNGRDMQWGGGTLFVDNEEEADTMEGGRRKLSVRKKVPTVDISDWLKRHTTQDDYVIFKLDVEGAEYDILDKMLKDGTFSLIDKFYGEYHFRKPTDHGTISQYMTALNVKLRGRTMLDWSAETRKYEDFDEMHPITNKHGQIDSAINKCSTQKDLSIVLLISMNAKQAQKIVTVIQAYRKALPITLFLYGDFVEVFPGIVQSWSDYANVNIGIRGDFQYPPGHLQYMGKNWVREAVVSAEVRLSELQVQTNFYLPAAISENVLTVAKSRGLTVVQPSAAFPPIKGAQLEEDNYYQYRDVERIPKALRIIHEQLEVTQGGVLALDADLPDAHMIIVFLLDYLVEISRYNIVSLKECIQNQS